ncbi:MAG: rubrerythrin family protein [Firmicutes bacterium]|nr:rubrerythrin family protein [Bacillota bacterium]
MNAMTAENLRSAFGGESQAHMRYRVWAKKAEKDGFKNVATLFRAISYAEEVHAHNHFRALKDVKGDFLVASGAGFGLGTTSENLQAAKDGEDHEIEQMYPAFKKVAEAQGEKKAMRSMHFAEEAEKTHSELYQKAKDAVDAGNDFDIDGVYVCDICGYTVVDEALDVCPVCGAKKEKFTAFEG